MTSSPVKKKKYFENYLINTRTAIQYCILFITYQLLKRIFINKNEALMDSTFYESQISGIF